MRTIIVAPIAALVSALAVVAGGHALGDLPGPATGYALAALALGGVRVATGNPPAIWCLLAGVVVAGQLAATWPVAVWVLAGCVAVVVATDLLADAQTEPSDV